MIQLTVRHVGNSLGLTLPKEAVAALGGVKEGDRIFLTEAPDGCRLTKFDPDFERQMAIARRFMDEHRDALRELSKR